MTVTLPGNLAAGTYYLGAIADYNNAVTNEVTESNNSSNAVQITVTPPAHRASIAVPDMVELAATSTFMLAGSTGDDTFVFGPGFGNGTITDFDPAHDVIRFDRSMFADFAAVMDHTRTMGKAIP
jgi:hypothetical protein